MIYQKLLSKVKTSKKIKKDKKVKPNFYIACGISGNTKNQVGMKDSKFIIAINKDEEAPIFQLADLGIVSDTLSVIPKINQNL